jgi:hypothetical protein
VNKIIMEIKMQATNKSSNLKPGTNYSVQHGKVAGRKFKMGEKLNSLLNSTT